MKIYKYKKIIKYSRIKNFARSKKTKLSKIFSQVFMTYYKESIEIYKSRRRISQVQANNIYNYIQLLFEICLNILKKKLSISERFIIIKIRKKNILNNL